MHTIKLRKVGGSVMFPIPKALLESLGLSAASSIGVEVADGALVVRAQKRPFYRLAELLAQGDANAPRTAEDEAWLNDGPVGRELI
jgi:antitoxin ChpS